MSTINPQYGFVICEANDPERTHFWIDNKAIWIAYPSYFVCQKPIMRGPDGLLWKDSRYELIPANECAGKGDMLFDAGNKKWESTNFNWKDRAGTCDLYTPQARLKPAAPKSLWPENLFICQRCGTDIRDDEHNKKCLDALIGSSGWIKCSDRLPELATTVLVTNDPHSARGNMKAVRLDIWEGCQWFSEKVGNYWAPIPSDLPKPEPTPAEKAFNNQSEDFTTFKNAFLAGYTAGFNAK